MPKGYGYSTGGKHDGKGLGPYDESAGQSAVSLDAANTGTTMHQPNVKDDAVPGGHGSTGGPSTSTPR